MPSRQNQELAIAARQILVSKRALQNNLPRGLINDPAVEILLSLFVHDVDQVVMSDTELEALVACATPSSFNRWLLALEEERLIKRLPSHAGEFSVELTDYGRDCVGNAILQAAGAERRVRADPLKDYQTP